MDRSIMTVYLRPNSLNKIEEYPKYNFLRFNTRAMLNSEFGKFCLRDIDNSEFDGVGIVHSKIFGDITAHYVSTAVKTLLLARRDPTARMPLVALGSNCAEAIYRCNIPEPTSWYWDGYFPKVRDDQIIWFPDISMEITGDRVHQFLQDRPYVPAYETNVPLNKPEVFEQVIYGKRFSLTVSSRVTTVVDTTEFYAELFFNNVTDQRSVQSRRNCSLCKYDLGIDTLELLRLRPVSFVFIREEEAHAMDRRNLLKPLYDAGYNLVIASNTPLQSITSDVCELTSSFDD